MQEIKKTVGSAFHTDIVWASYRRKNMLRYKKMLLAPCLICSVLLYVACSGESQQTCSMDAHMQESAGSGVPLVKVLVDDVAKTAVNKQDVQAVYCFLTKGMGWGGYILEPTVIAGIPKELDDYDKFEVNGIDVYVKKGTKTIEGILTITAEHSFWRDILIVKGMSG